MSRVYNPGGYFSIPGLRDCISPTPGSRRDFSLLQRALITKRCVTVTVGYSLPRPVGAIVRQAAAAALTSHGCREQLQRDVWIPQFRIGGLSMSAESVFLTARLPRTQFAAAIQAVSHAGMIQIQNVVQQK